MLLSFATAFSSSAANISFTFLASLGMLFSVSNHSTFAQRMLFTIYCTPDESVLLLT